MTGTADELTSDRLTAAAALAHEALGSMPHLVELFFRNLAPTDLVERSPEDLSGAVVSHASLARSRPPGAALVRVLTPATATDGWAVGGRSVVEVVTDDMPFLVDSVSMELSRQGHTVHRVIHPQVQVRRDEAGTLLPEDATGGTAVLESWMHLEIDRLMDADAVRAVEQGIGRSLGDVRRAVEDWPSMLSRVTETVNQLRTTPPPVPEVEVQQGIDLLTWLLEDHFTLLGSRDYLLESDEQGDLLRAVPGSGLGLLRLDPDTEPEADRLTGTVAQKAREPHVLIVAKANAHSTVHRSARLDYIGVKTFGADGAVIGERRIIGLFTGAAYSESVTRIPVLRDKVRAVLGEVGWSERSHAGRSLLDTLETYPRDELFDTPVPELARVAREVMYAREQRGVRVFLRADTYRRYVSALVYLPRDRYNTTVRERLAAVLSEEIGADSVDFTVRLTESSLARVHFVARPGAGRDLADVDGPAVERRMAESTRSWEDDWLAAMVAEFGEAEGVALARDYSGAFGAGYQADFAARDAARDVRRLGAMDPFDGVDLELLRRPGAAPGEMTLKVWRTGAPLSLSHLLPMIASLGVEVVDEHPYEYLDRPTSTWLYVFGLRRGEAKQLRGKELVEDALRAIWSGHSEVDGFNALVLAGGLTWREVWVLRAYAAYMRQGASPFQPETIQAALLGNLSITRLLVDLFAARFDPDLDAGVDRAVRIEELRERVLTQLAEVSSLDHDRILRSYLNHVEATLRTNHYRLDDQGNPPAVLSLKLKPQAITGLPEPRPAFEIFVHSPRVEGVHLRFGSVARGGLRWSDRRDDFRTEVLGLVKAQMVKNTVIVPVGAKGGFVPKHLPDPAVDREAWLAEGKACYRAFIAGLLDVTDNRVDGATVPPARVVRHDPDDSYLVVAADKGTATFSDLANQVAADYDFWLGDAFASGGSVGYDHKGMGITARGAWVSVRRHFRERGIDCQREDFTAVGIGDMSGDVFGNGMLCSPHTRLVAAFDHRDIFLDPTPDAAVSYAERRRLFELPRSSWADYDTSLISPGGGVWSRASKSVPVSAEVRHALGLPDDVTELAPQDLMQAVLKAPVDLLWNGGIGTYVKASTETHAAAGDRANDAIRVDGADLRAQCVGEGGNLGFTQLGRIEYARHGIEGTGGRINTDAIDNSAGVDTSDHEVNIKVLLAGAVAQGELDLGARNELLASMTDELGELVLVDNYEQNLALANSAAHGDALLHVHEYWMRDLEARGVLNRELEGLPSSKQVRALAEEGKGLATPELAVLLAWTKIVLETELLASDVPEDPFLARHLVDYFPTPMRGAWADRIEAHPLRRELVTTQVVNELVNAAGITYWPRLAGETGASVADLTRANAVARATFGSAPLRAELAGLDNQIPAALQTRMRIEMRTLCERASRWLVANQRSPLDSTALVARFAPVAGLVGQLPQLLTGQEADGFVARRDRWSAEGAPVELATRVAALAPAYQLLSVVATAEEIEVDPARAALLHFELGEALNLPTLIGRIVELPRADRWQSMARASLREDVHTVHATLTRRLLTHAGDGVDGVRNDEFDPTYRIQEWVSAQEGAVEKASATLAQITGEDGVDLARLSVAVRLLRGLADAIG